MGLNGVLIGLKVLFLVFSVTSSAETRAFLRTDSGFVEPEELVIDGEASRVSNPLMRTYEIQDFEKLKASDPLAWQSLQNHYRYGIVGTRGFVGGVVGALAIGLTSLGKSYPVIPITVLSAGLIYWLNSRHMAKHNLHEGVNKLNAVGQ